MSYKHQFIAKYGSPNHIDKLATGDDPSGRVAIASKHPDKHHMFLNDSSERVRQIVAASTKNKAHLDHFTNDPSDLVRANVVRHGHKEHLDKLANDKHWYVQSAVAKHGHPEHLNKMIDHPHECVRQVVADKGVGHDKLVHDQNQMVRQSVAENGSEHHRAILANDPDVNVRMVVAKRSEDRNTLEKLKADPHPDVARHAKRHSADLGFY